MRIEPPVSVPTAPSARCAAAGAVVGAAAGAAGGAGAASQDYETIYRNCMIGRGWPVLR